MPSLGDIRFIDTNPMSEGYAQRAGALTSQRAAEVQADRLQADLDEQQRQRRIAEETDAAMADVVRSRTSPLAPAPSSPGATVAPPPAGAQASAMPTTQVPEQAAPPAALLPASQHGLYSQAAARMASVRGGGKQAMQMLQAQQQQQDHWEEMAIKALGTNDLETFRYYQQKSGLQLPPEVMQSAEARANFARAMDIAKQNYHGDPQQGQVFAQTFMATPGDFQTKLAAASQKAGPPRDKPHWTATTVYKNGQGVLAFYDANARGMPQVQETGYVNHQDQASWSPTYTEGPDGKPVISAFNSRTGEVKQGNLTAGAKPTGAASKNMLVKIGQNSGTLYEANHEGPGQGGEAVITLPAQQAAQLAVSKGNAASRERIATITGDYGLARQDMANQGRREVADINGQWGAARVDQQGQNQIAAIDAKGGWEAARTDQQGRSNMAVQQLRNDGNLAVAEKRGQGASAGHTSAWVQQFNSRKAANPSMSDADIIAQMDTQKQPHEKALWAKAVSAADKEQDMAGRKVNDTPEKLQAAAERTFTVMKKGGAFQPSTPASARPVAEQVVTAPVPGQNARKVQKGPDGKDYPVVESEGQYATLPPGTVYFHVGKSKFLTKGK